MAKALLLIAKQDFRDEELFDTKEALESAGIETSVASTEAGLAHGKLGGTAEIRLAAKDANMEDYDALVFIGGPGAPELAKHEEVLDLAKKAKELDKVMGAICISPYILAKAGVISGKKATCYPAEPALSEFKKQEVINLDDSVVTDGKLVTADGPQSAKEFGQNIASMLE